MPSPIASPVPKAAAIAALATQIDATPIAKSTLAGLGNQQIRLTLGRSTTDTGQAVTDVVPENPVSEKFTSRAIPELLDKRITGMFNELDARGGGKLERLALSQTGDGVIANLVDAQLREAAANPELWHGINPAALARQSAKQFSASPVRTAAAYKSGTMVLGPELSSLLLMSTMSDKPMPTAAATGMAYVVGHELEHAVTPHQWAGGERKLVWLEEGTAETLARWPGRIAKTAAGLGFDLPADEVVAEAAKWEASGDTTAYAPLVATVRGVLTLAGVDTTREDAEPAARELLQSKDLYEVPLHLATSIGTKHKLPQHRIDDIASRIERSNGSPKVVEDIGAEIDRYNTMRKFGVDRFDAYFVAAAKASSLR